MFGLQEMGSSSDRATAAQAATAEGFTMTTDRTAVPIFYRTDKYTAIEQGRQRAFSAGQKVERRGGKGTERTKGKWVTWVQLQDNATQETFYVVNTHLLVGAYNKGVNGKNKKRIALYKQQLNTVTALTDQFQSSGSSVYVTCDCNVNYDADADPVAAHGRQRSDRQLAGPGRQPHARQEAAARLRLVEPDPVGRRPSVRSPVRTTPRSR